MVAGDMSAMLVSDSVSVSSQQKRVLPLANGSRAVRENAVNVKGLLNRSPSCSSSSSATSRSPSSLSSTCETSAPCQMTLTERLLRCHSVWFLPSVHRSGAEHLLQGKPAGWFIVRHCSRRAPLALSLRLPAGSAVHVQHYLVVEHPTGRLGLETLEHTFDNITSLVAHYCQHSGELPILLRLPDALLRVESRQQLASIALLGQDFWLSRLASGVRPPEQTVAHSSGGGGGSVESSSDSSLGKCSPPTPPSTSTTTGLAIIDTAPAPATPTADTTNGSVKAAAWASSAAGGGRAAGGLDESPRASLDVIVEETSGSGPTGRRRPTPPSSLQLTSPALVMGGAQSRPRPPLRWSTTSPGGSLPEVAGAGAVAVTTDIPPPPPHVAHAVLTTATFNIGREMTLASQQLQQQQQQQQRSELSVHVTGHRLVRSAASTPLSAPTGWSHHHHQQQQQQQQQQQREPGIADSGGGGGTDSPVATPASCDEHLLMPHRHRHQWCQSDSDHRRSRASRSRRKPPLHHPPLHQRQQRQRRRHDAVTPEGSTHYHECDVTSTPCSEYFASSLADKLSDYEDIWQQSPTEEQQHQHQQHQHQQQQEQQQHQHQHQQHQQQQQQEQQQHQHQHQQRAPGSTFKPRLAALSLNDLTRPQPRTSPTTPTAPPTTPPTAAAVVSSRGHSPLYAVPADAVVQRRRQQRPFARSTAHRHSEPNIRWQSLALYGPGPGPEPLLAPLADGACQADTAGAESGAAAAADTRRAVSGQQTQLTVSCRQQQLQPPQPQLEQQSSDSQVQTRAKATATRSLSKEEQRRIMNEVVRRSILFQQQQQQQDLDSQSEYDNVSGRNVAPAPAPDETPTGARTRGVDRWRSIVRMISDELAGDSSQWRHNKKSTNCSHRKRRASGHRSSISPTADCAAGRHDHNGDEGDDEAACARDGACVTPAGVSVVDDGAFTDTDSFVNLATAAADDGHDGDGEEVEEDGDSDDTELSQCCHEDQLASEEANGHDQENMCSPPHLSTLILHRRSRQTGANIRDYVLKLAADDCNTFALSIFNFIQCTREGSVIGPRCVMRNVRQFMNGMKNYLVTNGEANFAQVVLHERNKLSSTEFLNLDAILEGVLEELVVLPLHEHLRHLYDRQPPPAAAAAVDGGVQGVSQLASYSQLLSRWLTSCQLQLPSSRQLRVARAQLAHVTKCVSPLDKLEHYLLSVTALVSGSGRGSRAARRQTTAAAAAAAAVAAAGEGATQWRDHTSADDLLPRLVYTLMESHTVSIEFECDYMLGLLHPLLLDGEAGYYLALLSSAVHVIKLLQQQQQQQVGETGRFSGAGTPVSLTATSLASELTQHDLSRAGGAGVGCGTLESVLRVLVPDESRGTILTRCVPSRPDMSARRVCQLLAHKLRITSPHDYGLYQLVEGRESLLLDTDSPHHIKLEMSERNVQCIIAYKRLDAKIAWPTTQM